LHYNKHPFLRDSANLKKISNHIAWPESAAQRGDISAREGHVAMMIYSLSGAKL